MTLSPEIIDDVKRTLPTFSLARDSAQASSSLSAYLEYYGFSALLRGTVTHVMGTVDTSSYSVVLHYWQRENATATVFIAHGLFDHVGLYLKLVECLLAQGFSVAACDMPGHGLSSGEPVSINDFAEYGDAVSSALGGLPKDNLPLYLVGQSTGGAAVIRYLFDLGSIASGGNIAKVVLLAPLLYPRKWKSIRVLLALISPFMKTFPRSPSTSSHDKTFCHFLNRQDPLQCHHVSLKWLYAVNHWVQQFSTFRPIEVPTLLIQGTDDLTLDWQKNIPVFEKQITHLEVVYVDGAMHQLVNEGEAWRHQVFSEIVKYLK